MQASPAPSPRTLPAHELSAEELTRALDTDAARGLAPEEARRRLAEAGPNELPSARAPSAWRTLRAQVQNVLIAILGVAAALSLALGHTGEAVAISVIALFSVLLGFLQERRAERALEALQRLAAPHATVVRGGAAQEVPSRELVPGDVVLLEAGNVVPADARLLDAASLRVDEAALTGESSPVTKSVAPLPRGAVALGDRRNLVYASTAVTLGRGRAAVTATGVHTEIGKISALLATVKPARTPLEANLDRVGRWLARAATVVVLLVVALGIARGQPLLEMLLFGIALAVAVVPEALPAVVTISLALGAQRMVRRNALLRRLPTAETLGSTTVIGSDKTGTLTLGEMTVRELLVDGRRVEVEGAGYDPRGGFRSDGRPAAAEGPLRELLVAGALCNDATLVRGDDGRWRVRGDPTEGALVVAAAKAGLPQAALQAEAPREEEIPFSSERKRMTTLHRRGGALVALAKGAPEVLLPRCTQVRTAAGAEPLDAPRRAALLEAAQGMAERALRVLALAERAEASLADAEEGLTLLGLVGMQDAPRPEARAAIATCHAAGIRPLMITGDHPVTARVIAEQLGLAGEGAVATGAELLTLDDDALAERVRRVSVFARVSPADKLRIVRALQGHGEIVAMTGDGVNDAPALKQADIGVAMGVTGTDVAKEAAAMVLTDDNFASIVAAVEEGRAIFDNIKKYLMYLLSSNVGEILLMAAALLAGLPVPLTAVQILYVNLATDGLPALALAVDPEAPDLMRRRPHKPGTGILSRGVVVLMLLGGAWSALVNVSLFAWALHSGRPLPEAMTMAFVSLVLIQFAKAYAFRSERRSVLVEPFTNRWLNRAVAWELLLLGLIVYVPGLQRAFGTLPLTLTDWAVLLPAALSVVPALELAKLCERRGWLGATE